jgi:hypothetical protein
MATQQSASQICLLASRIAKGGTGMVALAGQCLNIVLEELVLLRNLKVNRETASILVSAGIYGPFDLPANYLRTYDMFYPLPTSGGGTASSMTQFLTWVTTKQFDAEFKSPSVSNYPYEFMTDLSVTAKNASLTGAGQLFIYPQTSGSYNITHRYMIQRDQIVNPESNSNPPWFADTMYMVNATAALMMGITGDDRHAEFSAKAEKLLYPYLIQEGDEQPAITKVELDPRTFHFNKGLKPTKAMPF